MQDQPWWKQLALDIAAAIVFYTCIPIAAAVKLDFHRVACYAPVVGLIIGGILAILDTSIQILGIPVLTRSALVVVCWVALTGGLHLDGAIDTADGLAVQDPQRRLEVMTDSATGAFGAMAAIAIMLLKITALNDIDAYRLLALIAAAGWGRWGQQCAIALYPYLKPTGKGAFHKAAIRSWKDIVPGLLLLLSLSALPIFLTQNLILATVIFFGGSAIAFLSAAWFNQQLGGHTGDTYGAVVEWTEALFLCLLSAF